MKNTRSGFSLIEMVMVLAVSGLMVSFLMQKPHPKVSNPDCYVTTKAQLDYVRQKIEQFARANERLPLPAKRYVDPNDITYGREAVAADITQSATLSYGALPFQALGLSPSYAGDCWGNKYTYVVTTALTTSASSGGYKDTNVDGGITLKGDGGNTINNKIAYAIISHGEDALGAVKLSYKDSSGSKDQRWCSGSANIAYTNCLATGSTLQEGKINDGKNAGANYFDDVIVAAGKPQIFSNTPSNAYCWGTNANGNIGDGSTTTRANATAVNLPSGQTFFTSISNGGDTTCALTSTALAYCWGLGTSGQLGNGTNTSSSSPVAVTLPVGVTYFNSITVGRRHVCALGSDSATYCWGYGGDGELGLGSNSSYNTPQKLTMPGGVASFSNISAGYDLTCAVANTGNAYCWGENANSRLGNGTTGGTVTSPTLVTKPGGVSRFTKIATGDDNHVCALANTGDAYCWGVDSYGELGNGGTSKTSPFIVTNPAGIAFFMDISVGVNLSCALADTGNVYCWGGDGGGGGNAGQIGDGFNLNRSTPTLVSKPAGVNKFINVMLQLDSTTACAAADDFNTYCWGSNASNQIGDGTAVNRNTPTKVVQGNNVVALGSLGNGRCSIKPLPAAGWNGVGVIDPDGNGANDKTTTPHYSWTTSQPDNYFKFIMGGLFNRCGITDSGAAYCLGFNGDGEIGDNTYADKWVPTKVTFPAGVTAWKEISTLIGNITFAIASGGANDGKAYMWGRWIGPAPVLYNAVCGGGKVSALHGNSYRMMMTCQDGTSYDAGGSGVDLGAMPAGTTKVISIASSYYENCVLADTGDGNGQVYCKGWSNSNNVIGNGTAAGTNTFIYTRVTLPAGVTKFTALAAPSSTLDGATSFCALGDDHWVYCWGAGAATGNGGWWGDFTLVPTAVTAPAGVTKFTNLRGNESSNTYVTAVGNDGVTYVWGNYYFDWDWGCCWSIFVNVPTKMPLPPGARGMRGIGSWWEELYY